MNINNDKILKELEPAFAKKINNILNRCYDNGIEISLTEGIRNPFIQAIYWKRSRSFIEIDNQIKKLININADFIAYCLISVGDQYGTQNTNAIPGLSWHQYGLAVDCVWIVDSKVCWDNKLLINGKNGYEILYQESKNEGIFSGHGWNSFKDSGHIQAYNTPSPLDKYSWEEINTLMEKKYVHLID